MAAITKRKGEEGYEAKGSYFDAALSDADKATMDALGRQWGEARDRGDQAAMDELHQAGEAIRAGYGYSGGGDGSEYIELPTSRKSSRSSGSSRSSSPGSGGRFSYSSAPTYTSKYQGKIDALTEQILGRAAFSYDPEKDPTYQQYKESYTRSGQRAMQDTLGQVSARTGGLASSYAGSAAQQTYDNYMSALADKVPELRQLAYEMYQDEGEQQRANLEMLMALEQGDYAKYTDLLGQYNTDRSFSYGTYRDGVSDQRYSQEYADSRADAELQRTNSGSEQEYDRALQKAQTLAAAGDFTGYKALGYSDSEVASLQNAYNKAQAAASASPGRGQSSSGSGSSGSSSGKETTGILAAMYAMGNDGDAYEYLLGLGYSNAKTEQLWKLYESGKESGGGDGFTDTGSSGGSYGSGTDLYGDMFAGLSGSLNSTLRNDLLQSAADRMTQVDYDPGSGSISWNGRRYASIRELAQAISNTRLTDAQLKELDKRLAALGL